MFEFLAGNLPTLREAAYWGVPALAWCYFCLRLAGELKHRFGLKTGYTRKVFHFLIFLSAALVQAACGLGILFLFGSAASVVIFYALLRGEGNLLYEAIARENDAPKRTHFIIVPYLATLFGGLASSYFFGATAIIGYLVTGLGDAIAEPVGTKFGRHEYAVLSHKSVQSKRSVEGSVAVFIASIVAIALGHLLLGAGQSVANPLVPILALGLICTLVEAVTPHGWDNLTLQVIPSGLAALLLSP